MKRAVIDYINANIPEDTNYAHIGTVKGNRVVIGNKSYAYDPAVDMYFGDGSEVYCILPNECNSAAVVGVR